MQIIQSLYALATGGLLLFASCGQPKQKAAEEPEHSNSAAYWPSSTPEAEGISAIALDSIHQDILAGSYGLIDHFMVVKNGKLVFDEHYDQDYETVAVQYDTTNFQYNYDHPAWHPYYNGTELHSMQSVTKSVTSMLLGIAVDEGLIPTLDTTIVAYFSKYEVDWSDPRKASITIEDLLTMRSGLLWDEDNYDETTNDCIVMELSDDWITYVLSHEMDTLPGTTFEYNSGASVLLGKIVREATGKRIDQWAEEKLFGPIGITEYYWKTTPRGEVDTEGGLYLSSHSLAKIGYLMLNKGTWEGQQVISEDWVTTSTMPVVDINEHTSYGYQWWVPVREGSETKIFAGNGYGGQFLFVSPENELITVFNGWNIHGNTEKSSYLAFQTRILPNLID